jgi:hypothetical protein
MKTFDQLNDNEKKKAIKYARSKLLELLGDGTLETDKALSEIDLTDAAIEAARLAFYPEPEDYLMRDICG